MGGIDKFERSSKITTNNNSQMAQPKSSPHHKSEEEDIAEQIGKGAERLKEIVRRCKDLERRSLNTSDVRALIDTIVSHQSRESSIIHSILRLQEGENSSGGSGAESLNRELRTVHGLTEALLSDAESTIKQVSELRSSSTPPAES